MIYDTIIIGAGPAGMTAGLYAKRAGLETLILEKSTHGGQAILTEWIENFPGCSGRITGPELADRMMDQLKELGVEVKLEEAVSVEKDSQIKGFKVKTKKGHYEALAVIIAAGAIPKKLGIPGEEKFIGKGVSFCATCDGPLFKGKDIAVVGGGNAACEEGLYLTKFAKKVFLVHRRDRLRADKTIQDEVLANKNIEIVWDTIVEQINGDKLVGSISTKNVKTDKKKEIPVKGVFVFAGFVPHTEFLGDFVEKDKGGSGRIVTDERLHTSVDGIFACGDCRKRVLHQIVTACGEGALAAYSARLYVEKIKGTSYETT